MVLKGTWKPVSWIEELELYAAEAPSLSRCSNVNRQILCVPRGILSLAAVNASQAFLLVESGSVSAMFPEDQYK